MEANHMDQTIEKSQIEQKVNLQICIFKKNDLSMSN